MPDRGYIFTDMRLNKKPLSDCELVCSTNSNYRLYVDTDRDRKSFYALAVEFLSCVSDGDVWKCADLEVDELFRLTANFDGARHLEFNRESGMPGYIYYPDMLALSEMFAKIRELEIDICGDLAHAV